MVRLLQREELGLGTVECGPVVQANEVFSAFVATDRYAFLREACALLNVPNLEDPVRVEGVYAATTLVADHVNDVVVLQRRSCP